MAVGKEFIDIENAIRTKFRDKKIPQWLINFIVKFIHQDYFNSVIAKRDGDGATFCAHVIKSFGIKLDVEGLENIPDDGTRYTFVSNHPLGGADGIALCSILGKRFENFKMPVNDFLMFIGPLESLCIPINKTGGQARNLPALLDAAFGSDDQILIFPAGVCSRKIDGKVQDLPWKKTFITKSRSTGRMVVPIHFVGQNSKRFYRVAIWRKRLRLKFNIEMAFLPDELFRAQNKNFRIIIGKPIPSSSFDASKSDLEWAADIREQVYQL